MQVLDIETSLSQGNILKSNQFVFVYVGITLPCIFFIFSIIFFILPIIEWDNIMISAIVGCNIFMLFLFSISLYIKLKNDRLKREIKIWLEDAIQLVANVKQLDCCMSMPIFPKAVKIQVEFKFNGKKCFKVSSTKICGLPQGYSSIFNKYINRKINILYSPKYDEVLILKDNFNQITSF